MNAPYSPGYNPYSSNELDELERQRQLLSPTAQPPAALATDPMAGIGYDQTVAPEPPAAPAPEPVIQTQPLDLSADPSTVRKGMGVSSITRTGIADPERAKLEDLHRQLTGEKLGQIEQAGAAERTIAERGLGAANARGIEAANQEVYKRRELEDSQRKQAELKKQQDEWAQKKEDGDALKAFGGNELAMVLTGIGMAAGTFSQAMGWQNANPVKDMFDKTIERSLASQREQKNSRLNVLAARLGDEKAAELQVRGEMHDAIATRLAAQAQGTQYQDSLDRLNPLMQDQAIKAKEAQAAAHEALIPKQTVTQTPVKVGGADQGKKLKEALELDALLEKQGRTPEQRQSVLKSAGMSLPDKGTLTAAEQTNKEQSDKEEKARTALDTDEKKDLRMRLDGLANVANGFDEIDKLGGIKRDAKGNVTEAGPLIGDGSSTRRIIDSTVSSLPFVGKSLKEGLESADSEELKALRRSTEKIVTGMVHAESGAGVNETELTTASKRLPLTSAESFKRGSAELWRQHQQTYRNLKAQYAKKGIDLDAELKSRGVDPGRFSGDE